MYSDTSESNDLLGLMYIIITDSSTGYLLHAVYWLQPSAHLICEPVGLAVRLYMG